MQKEYETPFAEKIEFDYKEQVVAQSNNPIGTHFESGTAHCNCGA